MGEHRESAYVDGRIVRESATPQPSLPFMPARVTFIVTKYEARCFWSGCVVPKGTSAVFYPSERAISCERCHAEARP